MDQSDIFKLPNGYTLEVLYRGDAAHEDAHPSCTLTEFFKTPWYCTFSEGSHFHFQLFDTDKNPAEITPSILQLILNTLKEYQNNIGFRTHILERAKTNYPHQILPASILDFINTEENTEFLNGCCACRTMPLQRMLRRRSSRSSEQEKQVSNNFISLFLSTSTS